MINMRVLLPAAFSETATRILDSAERLVQARGFNGFSYADVSAELGITKASIHHHFPTKAELGSALIARYHAAFFNALAQIDRDRENSQEKLESYRQLYASVLSNDNRMCLCGMLAADFTTLPEPMRAGLTAFFDANEQWLSRVLEAGRSAGVLQFVTAPETEAKVIVSSLEGAMLVARSYCDPNRFKVVADRILADLLASNPPASKSKPKAGRRPTAKKAPRRRAPRSRG